jgi:hypothetical protein
MLIFRLVILALLGLLGRRIYLALKGGSPAKPGSARRGPTAGDRPEPGSGGSLKGLTDQDISDADFEEIP